MKDKPKTVDEILAERFAGTAPAPADMMTRPAGSLRAYTSGSYDRAQTVTSRRRRRRSTKGQK